MKKRYLILVLGVALMSTCIFTADAGRANTETEPARFVNTEIEFKSSFGDAGKSMAAWLRAERAAPRPSADLPVRDLAAADLQAGQADMLYRLGHSTVLLRVDGHFVLTDPVFSDSISPLNIGMKRFHRVPIRAEELPYIRAVIISHDHYDHLDKGTVLALNEKVGVFVTPLRVGAHLRRWGIDPGKVVELDWWQDVSLGGLRVTATPAQHFSGRGLNDRDRTLWASWVIEGRESKIFFSGDSGYFGGFREIGDRFGPFDVTLIETGAYNELWPDIHMMPEQSLQAHLDLRGRVMLPIHNSSFDLSMHDWYEPLERIKTLADQHAAHLLTPEFGQPVTVAEPLDTDAWWRPLMPAAKPQLAAQ